MNDEDEMVRDVAASTLAGRGLAFEGVSDM
jgi:hypothetical protein